MDSNLVCLIVGFALGFGVRSALSSYRRAQVRKRINKYGTWILKKWGRRTGSGSPW